MAPWDGVGFRPGQVRPGRTQEDRPYVSVVRRPHHTWPPQMTFSCYGTADSLWAWSGKVAADDATRGPAEVGRALVTSYSAPVSVPPADWQGRVPSGARLRGRRRRGRLHQADRHMPAGPARRLRAESPGAPRRSAPPGTAACRLGRADRRVPRGRRPGPRPCAVPGGARLRPSALFALERYVVARRHPSPRSQGCRAGPPTTWIRTASARSRALRLASAGISPAETIRWTRRPLIATLVTEVAVPKRARRNRPRLDHITPTRLATRVQQEPPRAHRLGPCDNPPPWAYITAGRAACLPLSGKCRSSTKDRNPGAVAYGTSR